MARSGLSERPGAAGLNQSQTGGSQPSVGLAGLGGEALGEELRQKSGYYLPLVASWHSSRYRHFPE